MNKVHPVEAIARIQLDGLADLALELLLAARNG
jgi:hypothetical protein